MLLRGVAGTMSVKGARGSLDGDSIVKMLNVAAFQGLLNPTKPTVTIAETGRPVSHKVRFQTTWEKL